MKYPNTRILIFIKSPIVGTVKTRLMPDLTAQQACDIYCQLLTHVFNTLDNAKLCPIECWCSPTTEDPFIQSLTQAPFYQSYQQIAGDLGDKMYFAAKQGLQRAEKVILIGADCPPLNADYIEQAIKALDQVKMVAGPSDDGGYVLLGLNQAKKAYFENIAWGTSSVLATTKTRLPTNEYTELEPLWDLDTFADLQRWQAQSN